MDIELHAIVGEVKKLKTKPYRSFELNLLHLLHQLQRGVLLRGPYRLVLDSNIVMRLESLRQPDMALPRGARW